MNLETFLDSWNSFIRDWSDASPDDAAGRMQQLLTDGLTAQAGPDIQPTAEERLACEIELVRAGKGLDVARFRKINSFWKGVDKSPRLIFCREAWQFLRNPSLEFDLWWYWTEYLDPTQDLINPLVHYLAYGKHAGYAPLPIRVEREPFSLAGQQPVRRICLFAGYDVGGLIDDYVIDYVRELSRFADVYYLADGEIEPAELGKLAPFTKGAWSQRHGCYDFGSYSLLAKEYVGWETIETYDELMLVNDSCYLLRPLDDVFATMATASGAWWGMQATAHYFDGVDNSGTPMSLTEAKATRLPHGLMQFTDYLHVGSYFLTFRAPVITDPGFRKRLDAVAPQRRKINVITKYETGTTRYLYEAGFDFSTYMDKVYPYHPAYGPSAFTMVADGFPFFKRGFLVDNPYNTPGLADWKEQLQPLVPDADLAMLERNLQRVGDAQKLAHSFSLVAQPDGTVISNDPVSWREFRALEARTPTFDHWWAFPVCAYDHSFAGNERAVFEEVKDDPSIKKIILTRSRHVAAQGENVVVLPLMSREGQEHLARSGQIFVKHGPRVNAHWPVPSTTHNFINLWHGTPLKRFGSSAISIPPEAERALQRNNGASRAVLASGKMDRLAMAAAFAPLGFPDVWTTGLPRNDFILRADDDLPTDLRASVDRLRAEVGERRLVLFLPTFKDGQEDSYYQFSAAEVAGLASWAEKNNVVFGLREHMADKARTYSRLLAPLAPINVSSRRYPDLEVLYRVADALISDYSSCLVDFMITGRPVISFAYDLDRYAGEERGLYYDLEQVIPGRVCRSFDELLGSLDQISSPPDADTRQEYEWRRQIFHDNIDDQASWRVVQRVKALYLDDLLDGS